MSWKLPNTIKNALKDLILPDFYEAGALNLEKVAKALNIKEIILAKFKSDEVSGLLKKTGENEWEIYVNASDSPRRRRFTVAHEIGHLVSYLNGGESKEKIDENGKISDYAFAARAGTVNAAEAEANAIAARILMPSNAVIALYNQGKTVEDMADYFQVSESAMLVRLADKDLSHKVDTVPFETIAYAEESPNT